MAFNNFLSSIRIIGRSVVLPFDRIKLFVKKALSDYKIDNFLDFGSGTLFWTNWFIKEFKSNVCAVDKYYNDISKPLNDNIAYYSDLSACLNYNKGFSFIWVCDVLHHLSPLDIDSFLKQIFSKLNIIIIKDIDVNHRLGNFFNKLDDRIINKEMVNSIDPNCLIRSLELFRFKTTYYYIPKNFYPHFLLIGIRGGE